MKVLITGSTGFVGTNLQGYIKFSHELRSLSIRYKKEQKIEINEDILIHLAGKAHDLKKAANPEEYYQVNYELTKKLYDAFLKSDAKKFIFISSVKAVADVVEGILTEDTAPNPQTDYGKSKLMAEEYIKAQPLPKGKRYYILRPCMIHGPGNKGNLNLLYQIVKKGILYPLASFENKRSFLSVENLCFVIQKLIEKDVESGIYQVADDEALSTNEVVSILAESSGQTAKLWHVSKTLIKFVAKVGNVLHLPLNTEKLNKLTENYEVSNQKIKAAIGEEWPLKTRAALALTAKSFLG
ncbi:NAD-dependent epimerase/dehydratase family protein [Pedobacter borealis]|uniref:NAD-dependent epimerase/dehydratase family protein n=1 Tax=Pedobacter borealis TaxID=475254 RepID=UPI00049324AA|nr:NAD-dependent epimerase/dehydratase family protein [Pedobacter borealis]